MIYAHRSSIGMVRKLNEDSVKTEEINGSLLAVVADGMGGHNCGEVASKLAVDVISEYVSANYDKYNKDFLLKESIKSANFKIHQKSATDSTYRGMGTTVVAVLICGKTAYVANVGDSRLYHINRTNITQITNDHSMVNEMLKKGLITREDAENHLQKNIITRAVGTENRVNVDTFTIKLNDNDYILMCSDGLSNLVSDEEMKLILKSRCHIELKAEKLVALANARGGNDNISVIVIYIPKEAGETTL